MRETLKNCMKKMGRKQIALLTALLLVAAGLCFILSRPKTISYKGHTVKIHQNVEKCRHDPEAFLRDGNGRVTYEQNGKKAILGIDVSYHQGEIDWAAVAADGVEFAIIRLGYRGYESGQMNPDVCFERNYEGARKAGIKVGVYFFSQAVTPAEAVQEAEFVLNSLKGRPLDYPVVFDWETIHHSKDPRTLHITEEEMTGMAQAFVERIREDGSYEPMIYFNPVMGYLGYNLGELEDVPYWLARYDNDPDFYYDYDLWQYSHTGTVDGIKGKVDLNLDLRPTQPEPEQ